VYHSFFFYATLLLLSINH